MPGEVWVEITYPFPNFNGCTVEVWERIGNFISYYIMDLKINAGLNFIIVSKRGPWYTLGG